jgi:hypothetical protein
MKKILLLILSGLLLIACNKDEDEFIPKVYNADLLNPSQEALDDLLSMGYNIINGNVELQNQYDIVDMSAFKNIIEINGLLEVRYCSSISSLNGLEALIRVDSLISIVGNPTLKDIRAIKNIEFTQTFHVENNQSLEEIGEFLSLNVTETVKISGCRLLPNIGYFPKIKKLGHIEISGYDNSDIELINMFNALEEAGSISILTSGGSKIGGFANLISVDDLTIVNNYELEEIVGFQNLVNCEQAEIFWNNQLTNFCCFEKLVLEGNYTSISIYDNAYNPTVNDFINGDCKPN